MRASAEEPAETTDIPLERTKRALDILSGFAVVVPAQQGRNTGRFEVNPRAERTGDLRERAWAALVVAPPGFEGQEASMSESTSARRPWTSTATPRAATTTASWNWHVGSSTSRACSTSSRTSSRRRPGRKATRPTPGHEGRGHRGRAAAGADGPRLLRLPGDMRLMQRGCDQARKSTEQQRSGR